MPRYTLRTLLIVVTLVAVLLGVFSCSDFTNLGTVHVPPSKCHAGRPVNVDFVLAMSGIWIGGRGFHVGKVDCAYRFSPDAEFTHTGMNFSGEVYGERRYFVALPVSEDAAGQSLEYYFEFEVDGETHTRGAGSGPHHAKAVPFRVPIES